MQEFMNLSEALYRTMFEQSPLSIQIFSADGYCLQANSAWEKLWDAPRSALTGYNILEDEQLIDKGLMPYIKAAFAGQMVSLPPTRYDPADINRQGRPRWVESLIYPVTDEDGNVREVVVVLEDVTPRKEAEEALQKAYDELEARVQQRTAELESISQALRAEIAERKRAEQERAQLNKVQEARAEAEAASARSAFLAEASATLAASLDYHTTLKSIARLSVPQLADWCTVHVVEDDGSIRPLAITHVDPAKVEEAERLQQRYPADQDAPGGFPHVIRTGKSEFYPEITDQMLLEAARDDEHLKILRGVGLNSAMVVPLLARGRTLGAITFILAESGRKYTHDDLALAEDLARRCALAVDNARLYRETQEALRAREQALNLLHHEEEQMARIVEASGTLLGTLKPEAVLSAILDLSRSLIAADAYAVWRYQPATREWRVVSSAGLSEEYEKDVKPQGDVVAMADNTVIAEDVEQEPVIAARREVYRSEGVRALLAVPLRIQGQNSGTIAFYYHAPRHFSNAEVRVATALANLAASALGTAELYEEQLHLRAEAESANRLKDEFLATVSHELRTPLNAMLGWAQMLRMGRLDEITAEQAVEVIERNARSQAQIIDDILDVSRIITGKLRIKVRPVELASIINAAIDAVRPAAEAKGIDMRIRLDRSASPIAGDPDRLQQIIWNLLSNAIKFTPSGGRVEVALERAEACAQVVVTDTGQGITPEFLPHVFERFSQSDSTYTRTHGGLGLGLAIVRHLVEMHGGTVHAESRGQGQGARFTVKLPLAEFQAADLTEQRDAAPAEAAANCNLEAHDFQYDSLDGVRVLLVDDEPDTLEILSIFLSQSGAEVKTCSSAADCLKTLEQWKPHVLVSDIGMPEEDGLMLIGKVKAREPEYGHIPSVALTAYAGVEDRQRALAAGYQVHLPKPVEPTDLIEVIASLTGRA
jgi:PAS domain S-box-containing protein